MADLSAFFAKKNDKKKKNAVVKMDDVGHILERRAKKQEEHDREVDEEEKRNGGEEDRVQGDDSDWNEYENSLGSKLEGLNIKDMGAEAEKPEEEHHDVAEQKEQHETRKWGQVDKKEEKDVQTAAEMAAYQQAQTKSKFVPSALREQRARQDANIDVTNQEMFPSLADASKMEIVKKDDTKSGGGGWTTSGSDNRAAPWLGPGGAPPNMGKEKESVVTALREITAKTPTPAPEKSREEAVKNRPPSYVPPHLRNK